MEEHIDYNTEYAEYRRCKTCNRKTNGIEDFTNLKTKKPTKTCMRCRERIRKSINKKVMLTKPPNKIIIETFKSFLNKIDVKECEKVFNDPENQNLKILKKYIVVEKEIEKDAQKEAEKVEKVEKA